MRHARTQPTRGRCSPPAPLPHLPHVDARRTRDKASDKLHPHRRTHLRTCNSACMEGRIFHACTRKRPPGSKPLRARNQASHAAAASVSAFARALNAVVEELPARLRAACCEKDGRQACTLHPLAVLSIATVWMHDRNSLGC